MTVMKFGGATLRDAQGFHRMVGILQGADHALVVVSALARTTRDLEHCADLARQADPAAAREHLRTIVEHHSELAREVISDPAHLAAVGNHLRTAQAELERLLDGVAITRQCTPRTLDRILAFGERFALDLAVHALQASGLDAAPADARSLIVTTDQFGLARPIAPKSRVLVEKHLSPLLQQHRFVVTQGFVGATESGDTTTMGRESSNLTATFLASLTGADRIVVWTDVEGVRSADPSWAPATQVRPVMSYEQAKHAAHHGLKLLYRTMIEPAEEAGIPITIASAAHPDGDHTEISSHAPLIEPIVTTEALPGDMVRVNLLFTDMADWLGALQEAITGLQETSRISVVANPAESVVTITAPADQATLLAQHLHSYLTTHHQRIS